MAINVIDPTAPGQAHMASYWAATGPLLEPLPRLPSSASRCTGQRAIDAYFELQDRY